jgi:hypothetical protein
MATQANVTAVSIDPPDDDETGDAAASSENPTTLSVELDAIPGAVWQTELLALMPADIRVTLFERGTQKCALLAFPRGEQQRALEAFEAARKTANEVSEQAHLAAQAAREARQRLARD